MPETLEAAPETSINAMAELSALDDGKAVGDKSSMPPPVTKEATPPLKPKIEAKPAAKIEVKPDAKPNEEKVVVKPAPAKTDAKNVDVKGEAPQEKNFKELRASLDREKTEKAAAIKERDELKARITANAIPKEYEEKLTVRETELKAMRDKLAQKDFTESEEYQTQYYKPYVATWSRAMQSVMGLPATNAEGQPQAMTKEDAEYLLSLPEGKMLTEARRVFGDDNITALTMLSTHKQRIQEAYERMMEAKSNGEKITQARIEKEGLEQGERSQRIKNLWQSSNDEIAKSDPLFVPDADDLEGTKLLNEGLAEVDNAFSDNPELTPEKRIAAHAKIRFQSGAYGRVVAKLKASDEKISELETELKAYRESEPEAQASANGKSAKPKSALQELEELERLNR